MMADKWQATIDKPGWYWCINNGLFVARVREIGGSLSVELPGDMTVYGVSDFEAWLGPLTEPEDGNRFEIARRDIPSASSGTIWEAWRRITTKLLDDMGSSDGR
jgi:hypothetical protein